MALYAITTLQEFSATLKEFANSFIIKKGNAASQVTQNLDSLMFSIRARDDADSGFALLSSGYSRFSSITGSGVVFYSPGVMERVRNAVESKGNLGLFNKHLKNKKNLDLDYWRISAECINAAVSYLYTITPDLARLYNGLDVYGLKNPKPSTTLAVGKSLRNGIEVVYLYYNPIYIVSSVVEDVINEKYGVGEIIDAVGYLVGHEISHIIRQNLSDLMKENYKSLSHRLMNVISDLGINVTMCKRLSIPVVDNLLSPGTYFDMIVIKNIPVINSYISDILNQYGAGSQIPEIEGSLKNIKVGDTLRISMGGQLLDESVLITKFNKLVEIGCLREGTNSSKDGADFFRNRNRPLLDVEVTNLVVDKTGSLYIVAEIVNEIEARGIYLGRFDNAKFLIELNTIPNKIQDAFVKADRTNYVTLYLNSVSLVDLKLLSVENVFRVGDILKRSKDGVVFEITVSGDSNVKVNEIPKTEVSTKTLTTRDKLLSRILALSPSLRVPIKKNEEYIVDNSFIDNNLNDLTSVNVNETKVSVKHKPIYSARVIKKMAKKVYSN